MGAGRVEGVYPYSYPQPPPPARTADGLRWSIVAFFLYLASLSVQVVFGAIAVVTPTASLSDPAVLIRLAVVGIVGGILLLMCLVFYLIGFHSLYRGRNEFGPGHARDVRRALYLFIAAIVIAIVGGVVQFVALLVGSTFDVPGGTFRLSPDAVYLSAIVGIAFGIVVAALVASLLVVSVRNIARPEHQRLLYVAAALGTATPGVSGAIVLYQLPSLLPVITGAGGFFGLDSSVGYPSIASGVLGLVTFLLYYVVYRAAKGRIDSGELKPVLAPVQPIPWFPGPLPTPWTPPQPPSPPPP